MAPVRASKRSQVSEQAGVVRKIPPVGRMTGGWGRLTMGCQPSPTSD